MDESTVNVLTVFPQPAEGWLQLQWKTPASPTEVKVFNSVGALAAQIQWNTLTTALDVYSWPSGVYLMTLTNESGIIRRPIMVH